MKKIYESTDKFNKNHRFKVNHMRNLKMLSLITLLVLSSFMLSACKLFTVVNNDKDKDSKQDVAFYFDDKSFDANKFIDSEWNNKIMTTIEKRSVDILDLTKELKSNVDNAGKKYGIRSGQEGNAWNFIVKGKGKVIAVNKQLKNGTIDIDLAPYDGKADLKIQIGTVIKGTAIRDSLDFIKFDDYKNQMVFAEISNAIHKRVNEQILSKINFDNAKDKEIDFVGAFTFKSLDEIVITPVKIGITGGGK
jgi:Predicted periplasmic lipoprotein